MAGPQQQSILLGKGSIVLRNTHGELDCDLMLPEGVPLTERDFLPLTSIIREETSPAALLLERHFFHHPIFMIPAGGFHGCRHRHLRLRQSSAQEGHRDCREIGASGRWE